MTLADRLLALALTGAVVSLTVGCELEECDPDAGEVCDDPDAGNTDTNTPDTNTPDTNNPDTPPPPPPQTFRYIYVLDLGTRQSGQHPGSDIDAIEVVRGGRSFFATAVTDWTTLTTPNAAADQNQLIGRPNQVSGSPGCNVQANPSHWFSLAGGFAVVDMGVEGAVRDGDQVIVYECPGVDDEFSVSIGSAARVDGGEFFEIISSGSGRAATTVNFSQLGID